MKGQRLFVFTAGLISIEWLTQQFWLDVIIYNLEPLLKYKAISLTFGGGVDRPADQARAARVPAGDGLQQTRDYKPSSLMQGLS